jgi:hypothetical protein
MKYVDRWLRYGYLGGSSSDRTTSQRYTPKTTGPVTKVTRTARTKGSIGPPRGTQIKSWNPRGAGSLSSIRWTLLGQYSWKRLQSPHLSKSGTIGNWKSVDGDRRFSPRYLSNMRPRQNSVLQCTARYLCMSLKFTERVPCRANAVTKSVCPRCSPDRHRNAKAESSRKPRSGSGDIRRKSAFNEAPRVARVLAVLKDFW